MSYPLMIPARRGLHLIALAGIATCMLYASPDTKIVPAELVTKHLESIGSAEARADVHGTRIKGTCTIIVREGGNGRADGQTVMSSRGNQNLINMTFDSGAPSTAFGFDGDKAEVSQFRPGRRTALEQFFAAYEEIVKEGLVGGTLSESWPLLHLEQKNPKLEYSGIKKIDGKQLHVLKYAPRKKSELKITLFFEPDTFRHVRTEYEQTIYSTEQKRIAGGGATLPSVDNTRAAAQRLNAYEEFSDFKPEHGLTLPHLYKFELSVQSQTRPVLIDWVFNLSDFTFNAPLDASEFTISKLFSYPQPN
jgi:hypothetical protein